MLELEEVGKELLDELEEKELLSSSVDSGLEGGGSSGEEEEDLFVIGLEVIGFYSPNLN
ncbi:MAG TPA: hypothetical protein VGJ00_01390 [Rhabdochlamydiaceae bacterium]